MLIPAPAAAPGSAASVGLGSAKSAPVSVACLSFCSAAGSPAAWGSVALSLHLVFAPPIIHFIPDSLRQP
jgi:hypothetical protein